MKVESSEIKAISDILKPLPQGCVTRKVIAGKERFYLQWRENGRSRSRYLKAGEVEEVRDQIRRCRALEEKMREMRGSAPAVAPEDFETEVMVGHDLDSFWKALMAKLAAGWNGFAGAVIVKKQASPKGILSFPTDERRRWTSTRRRMRSARV